MHSLKRHRHWQNYSNRLNYWLKHSCLPIILLLLLLLLPKPWIIEPINPQTVIELSIIESDTVQLTESPRLTPMPEVSTETPPKIPPKTPLEKPINKSAEKVQEVAPPKVHSPQTTAQPIDKNTQQIESTRPKLNNKPTESVNTSKLSSGDVFTMIKNRQSIDISDEFKARTEPAKDFHIPQQDIESWMADIPYLDESIDKPKLEMRFYAEGIEGSIEKFFDKITISKTFTTQYGTKVHCALIGVIAACGWK